MKTLLKVSVISIGIFLFLSCKKDKPTPPVISTTDVTAITFTSASSGGIITNEGGSPLLSKGVCWNTTGNPTINDSKTDEGTLTDSFNSSLSALSNNTKYYARAYATNSVGTSYGNVITFSTPKAKLFIRGKFGNEQLNCFYNSNSENNYYTYTSNPLNDRFYLVMYKDLKWETSKFIQIDINRINIDTLRTPWENKPIPTYREAYVSLYVVDGNRATSLFGPYDSINYEGSQLFGLSEYVKIDAISGDTISGIFHGEIKTQTGLVKQLTNGEFKIKFHRIQQ